MSLFFLIGSKQQIKVDERLALYHSGEFRAIESGIFRVSPKITIDVLGSSGFNTQDDAAGLKKPSMLRGRELLSKQVKSCEQYSCVITFEF